MSTDEKRAEEQRQAAGRRGAVHIAEVAALAGVSIATVSRALTNPERVNAATRAHVLEVVRRTGYTPNVAGRSLRRARSMMVLVVVPSFITPFFSELLLGVDRALSAHGYGLLVGNLHDGEAKEARLLDLVFAGQADGVLLLNGHVLRTDTRSLADTTVPVVAVSVPTAMPGVPAVLVQDREGAAAVARHLLELGHRRFGYVSGPEGNYIETERWAGFSDALATRATSTSAAGSRPRGGSWPRRTGRRRSSP
jgi:LacI family transcriptional regulator, repressor for deo operon, udp, cdd, tsx, nupC, and nupG